jgi:hypothetical protein
MSRIARVEYSTILTFVVGAAYDVAAITNTAGIATTSQFLFISTTYSFLKGVALLWVTCFPYN